MSDGYSTGFTFGESQTATLVTHACLQRLRDLMGLKRGSIQAVCADRWGVEGETFALVEFSWSLSEEDASERVYGSVTVACVGESYWSPKSIRLKNAAIPGFSSLGLLIKVTPSPQGWRYRSEEGEEVWSQGLAQALSLSPDWFE